MNALRKILMPLLIIPLGMLIYVFFYPDRQWENTGLEYLFLIIGVPILVANLAAWFYPEMIEAYFPVKKDWEQGRPFTFAIVVSTLIACACAGIGAVSAVASVGAQPTFEASNILSVTATAFARSVQALASATQPDESVTVSTPRESPTADSSPEPTLDVPETDITPEQTPQIPVSGGVPTDSPTPSNASSALSVSITPTVITSASTQPTGTVNPQGSCTPATAEYMDAIGEIVQNTDPENVVIAGWMTRSNVAANLWFVATKIENDTGTISVGVWGLFDYSDGDFDIYAINEVAMDLSYAAWGEDSEPELSMQSDGAQVVYDCAVLPG